MMPGPRGNLLILANPNAGGGHGRAVAERARRALGARGVAVEVAFTRSADDLFERARAAAASAATLGAVAGGDGSLRRAATALAGTATVLGVLPSGRGNDLARALGIPTAPAAAAAVLLDGEARSHYLGSVGGAPFLTVATFGFDAEVSGVVHRREVPGHGTIAYVLAVLRTLRSYRPVEAKLTGDFGTIEDHFFLVATANTRSYGGGMRIAPDASPEDGLLDVCAVRAVRGLEVLRLLPRVFSGGHVGHPAVSILRTKHLRIECAAPISIYSDGEPAGHAPATLEALPRALRVMAPRRA
jgi:diacylglycerol kinase (ATP)